MIHLEPIDFISTDHVIDNIDYYKDKFINDSVICFRNANLTEEQQFDFNLRVGNLIGWKQGYREEGVVDQYVENHHHNQRIDSAGPDDVLLNWHVEHPYYKVSIVAATWNMYNFKTDPENGKTYFVDMGLVYDMLSKEDQEFLSKCVITHIQEYNNQIPNQNSIELKGYPAVKPHWLTNKPIIRIPIASVGTVVVFSYDGQETNREVDNYFISVYHKMLQMVFKNEDIRIVHKWKQGDLVMPDIFKLAHAVTGGFKPEDREFRGIWGLQK